MKCTTKIKNIKNTQLYSTFLFVIILSSGCLGNNQPKLETAKITPIYRPTDLDSEYVENTKTLPSQSSTIHVIGWYGTVHSVPDGSQFDDFMLVHASSPFEIGLSGATPELEEAIIAYRDKQAPGQNIHVWGVMSCKVLNYGGCQILVERLRPDGPGEFFPPDLIEAWQGTIHSAKKEIGSGGDDYFLLGGPYPIQYGIDGREAMHEQIVGVRDSNAMVQIWGQMSCGLPDFGGCQILVSHLQLVNPWYSLNPPQKRVSGLVNQKPFARSEQPGDVQNPANL